MNIAILVKEFPPDVIGGTETQTYRMAAELQQNHDVTVYTKSYEEDSDLDIKFDLVRVPNWHITPFISTLCFVIFSTIFLLRDSQKFDILQCMMIYPNGMVGYIVSKLTGLPYFAWIRGGDYYFMKENPVKRGIIDRVFRDTLVLVQTEAVREDVLREFPHASLEVLGNGVSIPDETANGDAIVFVGRLKQQKGVHVLLRAMEDLDEKLIVVGDGPERDRLTSLADELGVCAEFIGEVDPEDVEKYLRDGSVFVLPSVDGEGLPNALLEAMASGLPVIGTDTGGVRNAIKESETGFVVEPSNEDALRERIEALQSNPERRDKMGAAAREYVISKHSWAQLTERLGELYRRLINQYQ